MAQRRKTKRQDVRFPVSLGGRLPAVALDVSTRGFRVELPQVFLPGSQVHGFILHGEQELPFRGEVAWARAGNPQLSLYSEMGIRFEELSPALRKLLTPKRARRKVAQAA